MDRRPGPGGWRLALGAEPLPPSTKHKRTLTVKQEAGEAQEAPQPVGAARMGGDPLFRRGNDNDEPVWMWVLGAVAAALSFAVGHPTGVAASMLLIVLLVMRRSPVHADIVRPRPLLRGCTKASLIVLAGYLVALCFVRYEVYGSFGGACR